MINFPDPFCNFSYSRIFLKKFSANHIYFQIFREINPHSTPPWLSRNRFHFANEYCLEKREIYSERNISWNQPFSNFCTGNWQKFRESNGSILMKLLNSSFHEKKFVERVNFSKLLCYSCHFPQNFCKITKTFSGESKFLVFPHCGNFTLQEQRL